ncbi:MAG: tRNA (N6-threonylcarbamoyladenosine(37)-N6)-methyltransferase TrmO [Bdellovibrionales bacterium]|nr:tRNA (N6-threonylcarbamoyladenosine(37)-N6)-methyltransferase TrmO [Bdellovibrionales bacterium]
MEFKPIGVVDSPFHHKFATPRQPAASPSSRAILVLDRTIVAEGCLHSLEGFSHLWVIFHFHQTQWGNPHGKVQPPRLRGEKVGVFASRSPHRPNPIGLSLVKIENIDFKNMHIEISGVDVVDQTPIIDIKPYIGSYDRPEVWQEGWPANIKDSVNKVTWSPQALADSETHGVPNEIKKVVEESLSADVRNRADKKINDPNKVFAAKISDWDFYFQWLGDHFNVVEVIKN